MCAQPFEKQAIEWAKTIVPAKIREHVSRATHFKKSLGLKFLASFLLQWQNECLRFNKNFLDPEFRKVTSHLLNTSIFFFSYTCELNIRDTETESPNY